MRKIEEWEKRRMYNALMTMQEYGENKFECVNMLREEFDLTRSESHSVFHSWKASFRDTSSKCLICA